MRYIIGLIWVGVFICSAPLALALASENPRNISANRIEVFDVGTSYRFDKVLSDAVSEAMRYEVAKSGKYKVLDRHKLNNLSDGQKCQIAPYSEECFVKQGQLLNIEKIITGSVTFYRKLYYFSFLRIDAKTGKVENIVEDACNEDGMIEMAKNIARKLMSDKFFFLQPNPNPDWRSSKAINDFYRMVFQSPGKDDWQKPEAVVEHLQIKPGDTIAEIGAGTGYFTGWLARKTGEKGTVYAVDIKKDMLAHIEHRAKIEGLSNIITVLASPDNPSLPKDSMDIAFLSDVYVALPDKQNYFKKLSEVLKSHGKLVILDFHQPPKIPYVPLSAISYGTIDIKPGEPEEAHQIATLLTVNHYKNSSIPAGAPYRFRVPREQVVEEVSKAGFKLDAEYDFLPYQYFLVFSKDHSELL